MCDQPNENFISGFDLIAKFLLTDVNSDEESHSEPFHHYLPINRTQNQQSSLDTEKEQNRRSGSYISSVIHSCQITTRFVRSKNVSRVDVIGVVGIVAVGPVIVGVVVVRLMESELFPNGVMKATDET